MTRTFLVALNLEPLSNTDSIAADMLDSLSQDGFQVTSVKPWASANTDPVDPFMSLQLPAAPSNFLG
jgi:hypothetical protein